MKSLYDFTAPIIEDLLSKPVLRPFFAIVVFLLTSPAKANPSLSLASKSLSCTYINLRIFFSLDRGYGYLFNSSVALLKSQYNSLSGSLAKNLSLHKRSDSNVSIVVDSSTWYF